MYLVWLWRCRVVLLLVSVLSVLCILRLLGVKLLLKVLLLLLYIVLLLEWSVHCLELLAVRPLLLHRVLHLLPLLLSLLPGWCLGRTAAAEQCVETSPHATCCVNSSEIALPRIRPAIPTCSTRRCPRLRSPGLYRQGWSCGSRWTCGSVSYSWASCSAWTGPGETGDGCG